MLNFDQTTANDTLDTVEATTDEALKKAILAALYAKQIELDALAVQNNGKEVLEKFNQAAQGMLPAPLASAVTTTSNFIGSVVKRALPYVIDYSQRTVEASQQAVKLGLQAQTLTDGARTYVDFLPEVENKSPNKLGQ
ncbi:MAG: hypothetical protein AB7V32_07490 [Candidatus Berkiella sp.]